MEKSLLISNNTYKDIHTIGLNFTHDSGDAYSIERVYGIINDSIDCQLRAKSRFLGSFVYYWFQTNDYKKNKELSKIKFKNRTIWYNLFFWLSILALIVCIIWGIAIPIINSASNSLSLLQGNFSGVLVANNHIIGYVVDPKTAASILLGITSITDNNYPEWFYKFLSLYWEHNPAAGYTNNLEGCLLFLQDSIIGSGSQSTISILSSQLQTFIYFSIVGKTASIDIINSWNGMFFASLPSTSYYFGLLADSICLAGNQIAQTLLIPKIWSAWFSDPSVIISLIFILFLLIIVIIYGILFKKIKPKLNNLSFPEYLMQKMIFIKKFKFLINKRVPMTEGIKELNHQLIFCADKLGENSIYFLLRLLNYVYSIFRDMNLVLIVNSDDDQKIKIYSKLLSQDFNNLSLNIIDNDLLKKLNSDDAQGTYFRFDDSNINIEPNVNNISKKQNSDDILKLQFKSYISDFYNYLEYNKKNKIINYQLKKSNKKNCKSISQKQKQLIIKDVQKEFNDNETSFIKQFNKIDSKFLGKINKKILKLYYKLKKINN